MKRLWAPWRVKYISQHKSGCFFCEGLKAKQDEKVLILERWEKAFTIMNRYPYNNGHLMIAPIRHIGKIESLNDDEILQIIRLIARAIKAMDLMLKPQGYNMGINQGGIAGAGIADHLHIHLVPRWKGDTNFMLVLTETKVISEALEETYWKIKEGLGRIDDL